MTWNSVRPLKSIARDGNHLAFVTSSVSERQEKVEDIELFLVNLPSAFPEAAPVRLTRNEAVELNLEWAPDSRHLFFQVNLGSAERKYEDPQPRLYWIDTTRTAGKEEIQRWFADYPGEVGYGSFFDLNNAQGAFGASNLSPKPEAMAFATMTRVLDGTNTLGRVKNTPSGTFVYDFQQLNNGKVVTAAWTHNNSQWPANGVYSTTYSTSYSLQVDNAGTSGNVTKIDGYGNVTTLPYSNGQVSLTLMGETKSETGH